MNKNFKLSPLQCNQLRQLPDDQEQYSKAGGQKITGSALQWLPGHLLQSEVSQKQK
jgi:hypothetical protein